MRKRRPPRETKTVGGKAPKAPEAADAGQYAITGEEKSTAKSLEFTHFLASTDQALAKAADF